ncbi:MAG TPA: Flp family type IVb pilin [Deltaproteobacteria bacterium]|nr:Flp family type IVb pilin [Deltaproteobacteria bacterium]HCY10926.1 Flp family type IVb pilin [Deltaproteobacteria bacterium]
MKTIMRFLKDEEGATAAEYALLVALIGVVIIAGATALGIAINDKLDVVSSTITQAPNQ